MSRVLNEIAKDLRSVTEGGLGPVPVVGPIIVPHPFSESESVELLQLAERTYAQRRRWEREFDCNADLLHDPALDILLYLFIAVQRHSDISVSSACYAANTPQTTGLRCIAKLEGRGLVVRSDDPFDRRRQLLHLSEAGQELIGRCLKRC